ncbi:MAG: NTP transferase domain-containing protein [Candidatus Eisenbacteria sp.]|nr:NTP transferase domain-containing protein [Candidatus Eisenbacteria bacterium]
MNRESGVAGVPVFILAGGRGERLSGVTAVPKALLDVGGRPFITYMLAALAAAGLRRVYLLTGYRGELFRELANAGGSARGRSRAADDREPVEPSGYAGLELQCLQEAEPLGTGGALRRALPFVAERALVLNGDSYCGLDIAALLGFQAARTGGLCLAAARVEEVADFGCLAIEADDRLSGFREKGESGPGWINAGIYVLPRAFFEEALPAGRASLEHDILPRWVAQRESWAYRTRAYFCDIGTPQRLAQARGALPGQVAGSAGGGAS